LILNVIKPKINVNVKNKEAIEAKFGLIITANDNKTKGKININ